MQGGYTIPPQIGLLTNLVTIDFYQTNLYGTLPTEIGTLVLPVASVLLTDRFPQAS